MTFKTPLPHKVSGVDTVGLGYWSSEVNEMNITELQRSFNQLIDYLAEREVVEGMQVPTLKEQLLREISKITVYYRSKHSRDCSRGETDAEKNVEMIALSDVEAIINRIIKQGYDNTQRDA
jgi:hypothetical protein